MIDRARIFGCRTYISTEELYSSLEPRPDRFKCHRQYKRLRALFITSLVNVEVPLQIV